MSVSIRTEICRKTAVADAASWYRSVYIPPDLHSNMCDVNNLPAADENVPPVTLDSVKIQAAKVVSEIHSLYDLARELDDSDELPFDLYLVEDLLSEAEELSNIADGIE